MRRRYCALLSNPHNAGNHAQNLASHLVLCAKKRVHSTLCASQHNRYRLFNCKSCSLPSIEVLFRESKHNFLSYRTLLFNRWPWLLWDPSRREKPCLFRERPGRRTLLGRVCKTIASRYLALAINSAIAVLLELVPNSEHIGRVVQIVKLCCI